MLVTSMPWQQVKDKLPAMLQGAAGFLQGVLPLMPDSGVPLQLVHHDDVATAIALTASGAGQPGAYNIAGDGEISLGDIAEATGTRSVRVPHAVAAAASAVLAKLPMLPAAAEWIHAARPSVVMDTSRAKAELGWQPQYTSRQTIDALAETL